MPSRLFSRVRDQGRAPLGGRFTFAAGTGVKNLRTRRIAAPASTTIPVNIPPKVKRKVLEPTAAFALLLSAGVELCWDVGV